MPPPEKPPPLPLAPDRAALSNRISLLISSQSSVLKSMNLSSSSSSARASSTRRPKSFQDADDNDDSDLFRSRPNEGVGYIPDRAQSTKDALSREDKMLRGRILGKRGAEKVRKKVEEDEEDDDPGRSSLGKRKRPRRAAVEETTALEEEPVVPATHHEGETEPDEVSPNEPDEEAIPASKEGSGLDVVPEPADTEDTSSQKSKRKKKKKKKDKKGKGTTST